MGMVFISGGDIGAPLLESQGRDMGMARLGFVAGVIPQEKISAFERVLFRATRGNMFLKQVSNPTPLKFSVFVFWWALFIILSAWKAAVDLSMFEYV
jgi:hypothetical protein